MKKSDIEEIVDYIMKNNNIKNFKIQKYYQLKWFLKALKNDDYTFQKPSTWDDPFEDFISKLTNNHKEAYVNEIHITDWIYAMSTIRKNSECDGMWKNFAKSSGVIIHTNTKKLITSLVRSLIDNDCCNSDIFLNDFDVQQLTNNIKIEKIEYITDSQIADLFIHATKTNNIDFQKFQFKSLSFKRKEYENEYRVFLIPKLLSLNETHYLNIGYFIETIEKVVLSPKANDLRISRLNTLLTKKYNISPKIITKSKLHDIDNFKQEYRLS